MPILFGDALKRLTGGKFNLFAHPKIAKNPVSFPLYMSYPPEYRQVNFADASSSMIGSARIYNKLALETGDPAAAWMRDTRYGDNSTDLFDLIWPRHTVKPSLPARTSLQFTEEGWAVMRSDFTDPEKVMVACKAGRNCDPHHGHLDVGQFCVYWRGKAFIADLGAATYDEKYFDAEKYDTPQASSIGHNLVFVDGERQITGKLKDRPMDFSIGGKILEFRPGDARDYTLIDAADAYPKKNLKGWRRSIVLDKPAITVVVDEVSCAPGS